MISRCGVRCQRHHRPLAVHGSTRGRTADHDGLWRHAGQRCGTIRGARPQEGELAALVKDALKVGNHVVIIHAADDAARQKVEGVINATLPEETAHA